MEAVFALLISTLGGWWVDERFGTGPVGIFAGVALGFAAFVLRLLRMRDLLEPGGSGPPEAGYRSGEERDGRRANGGRSSDSRRGADERNGAR